MDGVLLPILFKAYLCSKPWRRDARRKPIFPWPNIIDAIVHVKTRFAGTSMLWMMHPPRLRLLHWPNFVWASCLHKAIKKEAWRGLKRALKMETGKLVHKHGHCHMLHIIIACFRIIAHTTMPSYCVDMVNTSRVSIINMAWMAQPRIWNLPSITF